MSELEPTSTELEPTATERLRALLTERGADYRVSATGYSIDIGPYTTAYANRSDTTLDVSLRQVTPEQAIAATLGRGTLTADDVRDLIERHSDASGGNGRDFHNGAYVAIADELNATLGSCNCSNSERTETCHPVISDNLTESEGTGDAWADCSECGHLLFVLTDPNSQVPNFCPNCGRRIEVDE